MVGQIQDRDEVTMTEMVWCMALTMEAMGARTSAGAVEELTCVVLEDFILRERTSDRSLLSPVRLNAMLTQTITSERPELSVVLQSPSDKSVIRDDQLKRWGLWSVGQQHARDATRHLVLWLRKNSSLWQ